MILALHASKQAPTAVLDGLPTQRGSLPFDVCKHPVVDHLDAQRAGNVLNNVQTPDAQFAITRDGLESVLQRFSKLVSSDQLLENGSHPAIRVHNNESLARPDRPAHGDELGFVAVATPFDPKHLQAGMQPPLPGKLEPWMTERSSCFWARVQQHQGNLLCGVDYQAQCDEMQVVLELPVHIERGAFVA